MRLLPMGLLYLCQAGEIFNDGRKKDGGVSLRRASQAVSSLGEGGEKGRLASLPGVQHTSASPGRVLMEGCAPRGER